MRSHSATKYARRIASWGWPSAALLAVALVSPAAAKEISYLYLPLDAPGANYTQAWGLNERGDVVGTYRDASGMFRGFLLRGGTFESITIEGASNTHVRAITPKGELIGTYRLAGELALAFHGFRRGRDGTVEPLDYPYAPYTIPQRILADGTVVGCFHGSDTTGSMYGFVRSPDGVFAEFDRPASMHNGATADARKVVGSYTDMATGTSYGYIVENGEVRAFLAPGASWTEAWDINRRGDVVGNYGGTALATKRGYLLRDGEFTTLHVPGAMATFAAGINGWGAVVGRFVDAANQSHGFIALPRWSPRLAGHPRITP